MDGRLVVAVATAFIILGGILSTFYAGGFTGLLVGETIEAPAEREIPQLSLEGYVEPQINTAGNVIFLTRGCHRIAMFTTEQQVASIEAGMAKTRDFRPVTHDLIEDIIDTFGMELMMVKIENVDGSTYYSKILIKQGSRILNLDSRPSDAIAIAVRKDAPVYIKEDLLRDAGTDIC